MDEEGTARVFFALWPDARVRRELDAAAGVLHRLRGGRRMRPEGLHLTLLFLGAVERARLPELQAAAAAVQAPAFEVGFDRAECWRHNRIAFLGASQAPEGLYRLVDELERNVAQAGFKFDRRPYKAHITLVRNADCRKENPTLEPIVWAAREFVLVESSLGNRGSSYTQVARWPLL